MKSGIHSFPLPMFTVFGAGTAIVLFCAVHRRLVLHPRLLALDVRHAVPFLLFLVEVRVGRLQREKLYLAHDIDIVYNRSRLVHRLASCDRLNRSFEVRAHARFEVPRDLRRRLGFRRILRVRPPALHDVLAAGVDRAVIRHPVRRDFGSRTAGRKQNNRQNRKNQTCKITLNNSPNFDLIWGI